MSFFVWNFLDMGTSGIDSGYTRMALPVYAAFFVLCILHLARDPCRVKKKEKIPSPVIDPFASLCCSARELVIEPSTRNCVILGVEFT